MHRSRSHDAVIRVYNESGKYAREAKSRHAVKHDVAVTAEELLLRHAYRRSHAHPNAGRTGGGLESPNLLSTRPDVYVESWAVSDRQRAGAVWCDRIGSYPSGGIDNNRASDIHSAEWIERRTISVEPEALHNGFRYEAPTEVFVPVEGPQIQPP